MLAILAAAILLQPSTTAPPKTLLQQVVPNPTGRNAFEDYLIGAQVLREPSFSAFVRWENWRRTRGSSQGSKLGGEEELPVPPTPAGLTLDSTPLEVAREKARRFGRAIDFVVRGNGKPYLDPTVAGGDALNLFPHLATFRELTRFGVEKAWVDFADGRSSAGFGTLESLLLMSANLSHGTLISYLVAVANQAIVLAEIERNLHRASLMDAKRLRAMALGYEQKVATPQQVIDVEIAFGKRSLRQIFDPTVGALGLMSGGGDPEESDAAQKQFDRMTPAQREAFLRRADASMDRARGQALAAFNAPEREWAVADNSSDEEAPYPTQPEAIADRMGDDLVPLFASWRRTVVTRRAQMRLLRLHADVLIYRWQQNKLPENLRQASGEAAVDPLTGESYVYTPSVDLTFRIVSKGTPVTGEIALRIRRTPGAGVGARPPEP